MADKIPGTVTFFFLPPGAEFFSLIGLPDGGEVEFDHVQAHEEGCDRTWVRLWREGDTIYREEDERLSGCDGSVSRSALLSCHVSRLAAFQPQAGYGPADGSGLPEWDEVIRSQRDYAAEAAGY